LLIGVILCTFHEQQYQYFFLKKNKIYCFVSFAFPRDMRSIVKLGVSTCSQRPFSGRWRAYINDGGSKHETPQQMPGYAAPLRMAIVPCFKPSLFLSLSAILRFNSILIIFSPMQA
jgi:hypothetical protein